MLKRFVILLAVLALVLTGIPVFAAEQPAVYEDTITVTAEGGRYKIGFTELEFKKSFMKPEALPATFDVKIYAENGTAYIEFSPSVPDFCKKVHIRANAFRGVLYDTAAGKNVEVKVKKQQILAEHFSRYAFQ